MSEKILLCTDLDRTLIPNGSQPESPEAQQRFLSLVNKPEVVLAYVTGRHQKLVQDAINNYCLPVPDFVIGDVGTTIFHVDNIKSWKKQIAWEEKIAQDWAGKNHDDLKTLLKDVNALRLQESSKQNQFKLSYYLPLQANQQALTTLIEQRFAQNEVKANLIWSIDEPAGVGLLDILPLGASKLHAIEALMKMSGFDYENTMFSGDSGNDIEVLASKVAAVLVANSQPKVRDLAILLANQNGCSDRLYIAKGDFHGMNGNYSAGILEGMAYYFPYTINWIFSNEINQTL